MSLLFHVMLPVPVFVGMWLGGRPDKSERGWMLRALQAFSAGNLPYSVLQTPLQLGQVDDLTGSGTWT